MRDKHIVPIQCKSLIFMVLKVDKTGLNWWETLCSFYILESGYCSSREWVIYPWRSISKSFSFTNLTETVSFFLLQHQRVFFLEATQGLVHVLVIFCHQISLLQLSLGFICMPSNNEISWISQRWIEAKAIEANTMFMNNCS